MSSFECRVSSFECRVSSFECRVSSFECRVLMCLRVAVRAYKRTRTKDEVRESKIFGPTGI